MVLTYFFVLASADGADSSWRTKSLERLIGGGKSKATRKEKLPLGWRKEFDGELERDVFIFKDEVRLLLID